MWGCPLIPNWVGNTVVAATVTSRACMYFTHLQNYETAVSFLVIYPTSYYNAAHETVRTLSDNAALGKLCKE